MTITRRNSIKRTGSHGVTLIELLVVVAIIAALTALMIPRMRIINKDRGIREAARVAASAFAKASNRAIDEGVAGIIIESNPNFFGDAGSSVDVRFAGTTIYQMRKLPPYIGDDLDAPATESPVPGMDVRIRKPLEHDLFASPPREFVKRYDHISFNGSSYRYPIQNVTVTGLNLDLALDLSLGFAPQPQLGAGVPFVIHRQPQKLESSRIDLPPGHMIDLRYSGLILSGTNAPVGTAYNQEIDPSYTGINADQIQILFDAKGGVDRMYFYNNLSDFPFVGYMPPAGGEIITVIPTSPLFWYVSAYETDSAIQPISRPSNMWVTINHVTGSANVASTALPTGTLDADGDGSLTLADKVIEAARSPFRVNLPFNDLIPGDFDFR